MMTDAGMDTGDEHGGPRRHTCNGGNGPQWGRKTPGCPRCDDLLAGLPAPVKAQHTCNGGNGPRFGRKTAGCPRCEELLAEKTAQGQAQHTCNGGNGPRFGRKTPGCPRCEELLQGYAPVQFSDRIAREREHERIGRLAHQQHFGPNGPHARGACGSVCTFGDW